MAKIIKKRLGDSLIEANVLTADQLKNALAEQKKAGEKLGDTLVRLAYCSREQIIEVLSEQMGIPFVRLDTTVVDDSVIKLINKDMAFKFKVIPLFKVDNILNIAMVDPLDIFIIDEIEFQTGFTVSQSIALEEDVMDALEKFYGEDESKNEINKFKKKYEDSGVEKKNKSEKIDITFSEDASPAVEIVNLIFKQAINDKASDIHVEPEELELRIRFRIDGILHEVMRPPKNLEAAILSRIKIMAKLDIAEKRIPQDGRIELKYENKDIDLRVSTLPIVYGEKIVMRLLDKTNVMVELTGLGFDEHLIEIYKHLIRKPHGILLVTGPTGSGKTSTLYGSLNEINDIHTNIVTLEDPVEYQLKMINQVQVNKAVGLTFASGLRSVLRQDPDIVMLGEIRDAETAEIAIEAAMTGHLVLSTLHTNSASGAISRLIEMGIEPFLISSSIIGVLGQRLVRKLCSCREEFKPDQALLTEIGYPLTFKGSFYQPKGCKICKGTGYKGRTGIHELLVPTDEMRKVVISKPTSTEIRDIALKNGMVLMKADGMKKASQGLTSIEEVLRTTQEDL